MWLAAAAVLLVAVLAAVVWAYLHPLALAYRMERSGLARAGMKARLIGGVQCFEAGQGVPVVLLHGAGDSAGAWSRIVPALLATGKYHVIAADLPGHGQSAPASGALPIGTLLKGVIGVLESLNEPAIVVGNSLGAWLACLAAKRRPELIARVVAVNGGPLQGIVPPGVHLGMRTEEEARAAFAATLAPETLAKVPATAFREAVVRSRTSPLGRIMETTDDMPQYLLDGQLRDLKVPVDLIWGELDRLIPIDYAYRMQAELGRATLTTIPHCGHVPQREHPQPFVQALLPVLEAHVRVGAGA